MILCAARVVLVLALALDWVDDAWRVAFQTPATEGGALTELEACLPSLSQQTKLRDARQARRFLPSVPGILTVPAATHQGSQRFALDPPLLAFANSLLGFVPLRC
jgi:hypothetical protein